MVKIPVNLVYVSITNKKKIIFNNKKQNHYHQIDNS